MFKCLMHVSYVLYLSLFSHFEIEAHFLVADIGGASYILAIYSWKYVLATFLFILKVGVMRSSLISLNGLAKRVIYFGFSRLLNLFASASPQI